MRIRPQHTLTRRAFGQNLALAAGGVLLSRRQEPAEERESLVTLAQGDDRSAAIEKSIESLGGIDCQGQDVYLKGNYGSAHVFPATTHPETLTRVVRILKSKGCRTITLVERSGMGTALEIWRTLGIDALAKRLEINLLSLDDLPDREWRREEMPDSHWRRGVEVPRFLDLETIWIQISNLKTHRFGAHFSASLKNAIGLIAKHSHSEPAHNYMTELHGSQDQRLMIAEVNRLYKPSLVVMDATEIFIDGGPESGEVASPRVVMASRDRVALDAVGLALLRLHSAGPVGRNFPIYEEDQVKRAAELGLGAKSPDQIRIDGADGASRNVALQIKAMLTRIPDTKKRPS